jgi:hypothetical protein
VISATIHSWTAEAADPEVLCVIVLDRVPIDYALIGSITDCIDATAPAPVTIDWNTLESAQAALRTRGHPMTEIASHGVHVTGALLSSLVADPCPFDEAAAKAYCHETSSRWVSRIRERSMLTNTGADLSLALEGAANAALMHHRLGRIARPYEPPSKAGTLRLGALVGTAEAAEVVSLIDEMRGRTRAEVSHRRAAVRRLVDVMLQAASVPDAPGCYLG